MVKEYICPRCKYTTHLKANYRCHLQRKTTCAPTHNDTPVAQLLEDLDGVEVVEYKFRCDRCHKGYASRQGLHKHKLSCNCEASASPPSNQVDQLTQMIKQMQEKLDTLTSQNQPISHTNIQTQNNIQQQTNNITINLNNFGSETYDHITDAYSTQCVLNKRIGFVNFIKALHFNEEVPQNRTFRLKSKKQGLLEKYVNGHWTVCDKNQTLDHIIEHNKQYLYMHFINNKDSDSSLHDNEEQLLQWFLNLTSPNATNNVHPEFYRVRKELYMLILWWKIKL